MTTPAVIDYMAFLRAVANHTSNGDPPPPPPAVQYPTIFLMEALSSLGVIDSPPPTRTGIDSACDILFSHPDIIPLIADASQSVVLQAHFVDRYLPQTMCDYWTHIILPAWQQHTELQNTLLQSAIATDSRTRRTSCDSRPVSRVTGISS
jgi:hypothetical protein